MSVDCSQSATEGSLTHIPHGRWGRSPTRHLRHPTSLSPPSEISGISLLSALLGLSSCTLHASLPAAAWDKRIRRHQRGNTWKEILTLYHITWTWTANKSFGGVEWGGKGNDTQACDDDITECIITSRLITDTQINYTIEMTCGCKKQKVITTQVWCPCKINIYLVTIQLIFIKEM